MYYIIDKDTLYNRVDEIVSRVADEAYAETGDALYDAVVLTERDRPLVGRYIDEAADALVHRCSDISKYSAETGIDIVSGDPILTGRMRIQFFSPTGNADMEAEEADASEAISRYIALCASHKVFEDRRAAVVPQFAQRVQESMDNAVRLLRKRTAPTR